MKRLRRIPLILGGVVFLLLVAVAFLARPAQEGDLAFLKDFRYTVEKDEQGDSNYRIFGDSAKILAEIPGASSGKVDVTPQGTTYNFFLPSGKAATFFTSRSGMSSRLLFDNKPSSWLTRMLHRLGLS